VILSLFSNKNVQTLFKKRIFTALVDRRRKRLFTRRVRVFRPPGSIFFEKKFPTGSGGPAGINILISPRLSAQANQVKQKSMCALQYIQTPQKP